MAAEHLVQTGRRRLAYVGGPFELRQVTDRLAGARVAVEEASGVAIEVIAAGALTVDEGIAAGRRIAERRDRPDAVFAANDLLALGLLQAFVGAGIRVPHDIALIGFDDISFAGAAAVPLSSMRQPSRMIGQTALRILLEEAADPGLIPRQTVFQPELVVRASTARP
jgi:LacI family transcriptional regulator